MVCGLQISRSRLVAVGIGCLAVMVVLGLSLRGNHYPTGVDDWGWRHINSSQLFGRFDVSVLGSGAGIVGDLSPMGSASTGLAAGVGLALAYHWRGDRRLAWLCFLSPATALVMTDWLLKPVFDRHMGTALAYPSGHTSITSAVGTVLVLLAYRKGGLRRSVIVAGLVLLPIAAGVLFLLDARLHYPTDVVGGVAAGIGIAVLLAAWLLPSAPPPAHPAARPARRLQPVATGDSTD